MSPEEKELLCWIVDELEALALDYWGGNESNLALRKHEERIRSLRNMLALVQVTIPKRT